MADKQIEFITHANKKYNIAHGSVRAGKTICVLFAFMKWAFQCPGEQIWMIGHTHESVYHNCIRFFLEEFPNNPLDIYKDLCTWMPGKSQLKFGRKTIYCLGARDERSIGPIQGKTFDLCYCNEMTLYPENVIQMISTRLSMPHSMLFADMNPVQPSHKCKEWIDLAESGDPNYYSLHFTMDDNPYLTQEYKDMQKQILSGLFLRRNYYGEWCLAEGAIFDFFDKKIHVVTRIPPHDFWIAGIDYGTSNAFSCVLIGVKTPKYANDYGHFCVEREYYYDSKNQRQKSPSEYARELNGFLGDTPVRAFYLDPSAAYFKQEMRLYGYHCSETNNEVLDGIVLMTTLLKEGTLTIYQGCANLIREIEGYSWDPKSSAKGWDEPLKVNDHAVDSLRYALMGYTKGRTKFGIGVNTEDPQFGRSLGKRNMPDSTFGGKLINEGQWRLG